MISPMRGDGQDVERRALALGVVANEMAPDESHRGRVEAHLQPLDDAVFERQPVREWRVHDQNQ